MVLSIANIIFLLLHIFNRARPTSSLQKPTVVYGHWTVSGYMVHMHKTGVYGYGYIHGNPRKICGYGYGYGWEISYPRQPWQSFTAIGQRSSEILWRIK